MKKNGELKETDFIRYGIQDTVEVKLRAKAKDQRVIHQRRTVILSNDNVVASESKKRKLADQQKVEKIQRAEKRRSNITARIKNGVVA